MKETTPLLSSKDSSLSPSERLSWRLSSTNFSKSLSSRQRALKERGVGHAAHLVKDAVFGRQDAPYHGYYDPYQHEQSSVRDHVSVVCGRLVIQLRGAVLLSGWALFALTLFEPPRWCRDASHLQIVADSKGDGSDSGYGDCRLLFGAHGTAAGGEENQPYYPNSGAMLLTVHQSRVIELICACFISLYMALAFADDGFEARYFFYPGYKRWTHVIQCLVLACLIASEIFDVTTFNPFLRMIILGTFLRTFQRELWTCLKMIPQFMVPLSMLAIIVGFYAWFGVVMFHGSPQGIVAFPNLAEGMWTLWICITTANYPDVGMPSYNENRFVALYFVSFMVISFFYMMNLVLAVAVDAYDKSITERKCSRKDLAEKSLSEAFTLLDKDGDGTISRESIMNVMTILNQDIPEVRGLSEEEKAIMFAFLDKDGDNTIVREEFALFGSVLLLKLAKKSDYATFVETHFPSVFRSNWYQVLCKSVKSGGLDLIIDVLLILNAAVIAAQDYPILTGHDPRYQDGSMDSAYEGAETMFAAVYVVEAALKIMVHGWKQYIESPKNIFDFIITAVAALASAYVYYPNAYSNLMITKFIVMVRVLRLGRLLFIFEKIRFYGAISMDIIPAAASVFTVQLFIAYLFSSMGMIFYGGAITRDPKNPFSQSLLEADDFVEGEYWANNFNDMFSGLNVLFNWLVINNWTEQTSGMEHATGDKWPVRLFFFSFYLLGVIGIGNVVTSFVINAFLQRMAMADQKWDEVIEGEATLEGSRAVFDPSSVTGTETGLGGGVYFARINPTHVDVELDERAALKKLFTKERATLKKLFAKDLGD